jgi:hypothetical protein
MNRRNFIGLAGGAVAAAGAGGYLLSDKSNLVRSSLPSNASGLLLPDESKILSLASLAPSGHNTQPWFVQRMEPFHWIIGNEKSRWLPAVDPTQRETMLSLGAFLQNLEYAAGSLGYDCCWNLLATTNQDERVMEVTLAKGTVRSGPEGDQMTRRRTVREGQLTDVIKKDDLAYLGSAEGDGIHYLATGSKESQYLNEQTIEANRRQADRDPAQRELADWIRFSSHDAAEQRDGLTTATLDINGIAGWWVRNFYRKGDVLKPDFRRRGLDKVRTQVTHSDGWLLITAKNDTVESLLETGRRMERVFLKIRDRGIAIHPMTQILEEPSTRQTLNESVGIADSIQFILRAGYVKDYPEPVSLRRPPDWFVRK